MGKRVSKAVIGPKTKEELAVEFGEYAELASRKATIEAEINEKVTAIRREREEELTQLADSMKEKEENLQLYAQANMHLFDSKKSIETIHGKFGFRTGTPKLKPRKGYQWLGVLELVKAKLPKFVRTVEEVNKEAIIAQREEPELAELIAKGELGIDVVQEEKFFVEIKNEVVTA